MIRGIIFGFVLMVGCSRGDRVAAGRDAGGDSTARAAAQPVRSDSAARADSGGRRDTAAIAEHAPAEDPPCFASHLGLPCQ